MTKKEITTIAQPHYAGYASEFGEKDISGKNSLQTPSPQGEHKDYCAKLDGGVDAVAVAENSVVHNNMKNAIKYCNRKSKNKRRLEELPDGRVISSDMPQSVVDMCKNYDEDFPILREKMRKEQEIKGKEIIAKLRGSNNMI